MSNFKSITIKSWSHFLEITQESLSLGGFAPCWSFRGQSDSSWTLDPSLARILKSNGINHPVNACQIEKSLTRYFLTNNKHFEELKNVELNDRKGNAVLIWSFMQHYGAPTRLLDWTDSPMIGLYYAVEGNWTKDGALYMINNEETTRVSEKKHGKFELEKDRDASFSNSFCTIVTFQSTKRSYNQQGLFTISNNPLIDQQEAIEELNIKPDCAFKLIIPKELKLEFLKKLRGANVKADILYPDAFGLGRELQNLAIIRANEI